MYASFLTLPVTGRHSRALHLKLFTVPSALTTFCEVNNVPLFFLQHLGSPCNMQRIATQWILSAEVSTIVFKKQSGHKLGMMDFLNLEGMKVFVRS